MAKKSFPEIARDWSRAGQPWVFVADENYGEGSSREHAAMEPRYRGARAIIARSFARIAETNLKKQGVLPLFFEDPATYDLIAVDSRISILGLAGLAPDTPLNCQIHQTDGSVVDFRCTHTFSPEQIEWFKAGGALNLIRQQFAS
jgi:aconitate hydratase